LKRPQQNVSRPCCAIRLLLDKSSSEPGLRPKASWNARVTRDESSDASLVSRAAKALACRCTKALFIRLRACNAVVVMLRLGVLTEGTGQSNASSMGLPPELTLMR